MNWEAIGAIAEVIGGIAVVITIAYLAIQIRHSTMVALESERNSHRDRQTSIELQMLQSDSFAALARKVTSGGWLDSPAIQALQEEFELTDVEFMRVHFYWMAYVSNWQRVYSSSIMPMTNKELANYLGTFISNPFSVAWWRVVRNGYDKNFRTAVDSVLQRWEQRTENT